MRVANAAGGLFCQVAAGFVRERTRLGQRERTWPLLCGEAVSFLEFASRADVASIGFASDVLAVLAEFVSQPMLSMVLETCHLPLRFCHISKKRRVIFRCSPAACGVSVTVRLPRT